MEFARCVYGTPGTACQVIIAYLCQECGHLPYHDYDYFVVKKAGKLSGWFCAYCRGQYDRSKMQGLLSVIDRTATKNSVVVRICMPSGRMANVVSLMKMINCMRTGNFTITEEAMTSLQHLATNLRTIIARDNRMAAAGLKQIGATETAAAAKSPEYLMGGCGEWCFAEEPCDLTLRERDTGTLKRFLNVKDIMNSTCSMECTRAVVSAVCKVVFACYGMAEVDTLLFPALKEDSGISGADLQAIVQWVAVRKTGNWADGSTCKAKDKQWYLENDSPFCF